jgi:acetyltransferase-like isoleucine patch superfamily enzyme
MLRKLYNQFFTSKPAHPFISLAKSGNLKYGTNCKLDSMSVSIEGRVDHHLNIEIGDDCYIMGTITLLNSKAKVKIGNRVFIGPGTTLFCYKDIEISDDIMVSWGCTLIDTNAHSLKWEERKNDVIDWIKGPAHKNWSVVESKPVLLQSKCWIGFNSIITKGVIVGEGGIVASGSVVTKSVDPFTVVGGNPATFIKNSF